MGVSNVSLDGRLRACLKNTLRPDYSGAFTLRELPVVPRRLDCLQLIPPFVKESSVHQSLEERDDVVATLQPFDSHLPERFGISIHRLSVYHSHFLSLQSANYECRI
jgi:hypothetical protein